MQYIITFFYFGKNSRSNMCSRERSPRKPPPPSELKPNPVPNLNLTLPLTSHGDLFSGGFFPDTLETLHKNHF